VEVVCFRVSLCTPLSLLLFSPYLLSHLRCVDVWMCALSPPVCTLPAVLVSRKTRASLRELRAQLRATMSTYVGELHQLQNFIYGMVLIAKTGIFGRYRTHVLSIFSSHTLSLLQLSLSIFLLQISWSFFSFNSLSLSLSPTHTHTHSLCIYLSVFYVSHMIC
jgi:hypothetical protein